MIRRVWVFAIESVGWLELLLATTIAAIFVYIGQKFKFQISNGDALYSAMLSSSIGLMAVSAIVVTLLSALSPNSIRLKRSIYTVSTLSFVPIAGLFLGALVALLLLATAQVMPCIGRQICSGVWLGITCASVVRSVGLGRNILALNLESRTMSDRGDLSNHSME